MSEQPLGLRRSWQIVRRHWIAVSLIALLGLLTGIGYTELNPPKLSSIALVMLPPAGDNVPTEVVIASSDPVLVKALAHIAPVISLQTLRSRIQVNRLAQSNIVSITAVGKTAAQAEHTANAVADSFVAYAIANKGSGGKVPAQLLEPARNATGTSLLVRRLETGGLGTLLGALVGAIAVLGLRRSDRRLRQRDDIADTIGVPVLASLPVRHPTDTAGWATLLEQYEPAAVHAWRLRNALDYLGLAQARVSGVSGGQADSLTVLSLSSDRRALALGPQLAVAAASQGIPTALIIGPQQDTNTAATLRAACAVPSLPPLRSGQLRVGVADRVNLDSQPDALLTIVVTVVDGGSPHVAETIRTKATVLGVTAGATTGEQLARVAASAAADGRKLRGVILADPDPTDHTTGRIPQPARPARRTQPTRLVGVTMETRR